MKNGFPKGVFNIKVKPVIQGKVMVSCILIRSRSESCFRKYWRVYPDSCIEIFFGMLIESMLDLFI